MAIAPRIEIKQSQSLMMTPQLQQAIKLLQMSNLELQELVNQELEVNPFLEREDDVVNEFDINHQTIDDFSDENSQTQEDISYEIDMDYNNLNDDYGSDCEGYEQSDFSWDDYSKSKSSSTEENFDFYEKKLSEEKNLITFLEEQIRINFYTSKEKMIAFSLIEYLDDAGYFRADISEVSKKLGVTEECLEDILYVLKGFEPSGIFSQSLSECLEIQLKDRGEFSDEMKLLLKHLDLLAERKYKNLIKICNLSDEKELFDLIKKIKFVNPKPAADFYQEKNQYVIPDVFVKRGKYGEYLIELNPLSLPKVLINHEYKNRVMHKDKKVTKFVKSQIGSANFLMKALHQRATSILTVCEEIVKNQYDFFEKGINFLKPMQLKDIAEAAQIHESTVSRISNNKYMHTPLGLFELKYFFSVAAGSYKGDESVSTTTIKHQIKELIEKENPQKILSDDNIVELLAVKGIKIARRTVAKYRESLSIPTSAERKRIKRDSL